jgi:hypothetical protein
MKSQRSEERKGGRMGEEERRNGGWEDRRKGDRVKGVKNA